MFKNKRVTITVTPINITNNGQVNNAEREIE